MNSVTNCDLQIKRQVTDSKQMCKKNGRTLKANNNCYFNNLSRAQLCRTVNQLRVTEAARRHFGEEILAVGRSAPQAGQHQLPLLQRQVLRHGLVAKLGDKVHLRHSAWPGTQVHTGGWGGIHRLHVPNGVLLQGAGIHAPPLRSPCPLQYRSWCDGLHVTTFST